MGNAIDDPEFDAAPSANATCYFNAEFKPSAQKARNSMGVSIGLLILGFTTRLFKLHQKFLCFKIESMSRYMINKVLYSARFFQKGLGTSNLEDRIVSNMIVAAHITVCIWIDMYTSMASDIYWLIVSLTWGTLKISELISLLHKVDKLDNTWTFGQVLPVLLLALPMMGLVEQFLKSLINEKGLPALLDSVFLHDSTLNNLRMSNTIKNNDSQWILRPENLDEYYRSSIWMFWVVSICHTYISMMTYQVLLLRGYTSDKNSISVPNDTVAETKNMAVWFIFMQGVTVQTAILLTSLIEMKLKSRGAIHVMTSLTGGGLIFASTIMYTYLRDAYWYHPTNTNMVKYEYPMFCVAGAVALFVVALVARQISACIRR